MAEMDVRSGRVDAQLDAQRATLGTGFGQLLGESPLGKTVDRMTLSCAESAESAGTCARGDVGIRHGPNSRLSRPGGASRIACRRPAALEEASLRADPLRRPAAWPHLFRVRHVRGRRVRPAFAHAVLAVQEPQSSVLLDDLGHPIGVLSEQDRVIVTPSEIPPIVKDAVISIEDKRFRTNSGVDIRGIARAFVQDIAHKGNLQGASTSSSSSSRTRCKPNRTGRSSRSCARRRWPTSSRTSGEGRSSPPTSTRSIRQRRLRDRVRRPDVFRLATQASRLRHTGPRAVRSRARAG